MSKRKGNRIDTGEKDSLGRPKYNWESPDDRTVNKELVNSRINDFDIDDISNTTVIREFPGRIRQLRSLATDLDDTGLDIMDDYSGAIYRSIGRKDYETLKEQLDELEKTIIKTGNNASWINPEYSNYFKEKSEKVRNKTGINKIKEGQVSFEQLQSDAENLQPLFDNLDDWGLDYIDDQGINLINEYIWGNDKKSYKNTYEYIKNTLIKHGDDHYIDKEKWKKIKSQVK